jgi:ABC-type ATPase involved in cell division
MATTQPPRIDGAATAPLIALERVEQRYGAFRPALVGIDLSVARGEFLVLAGPGGSGKSVLLRLLAGLETPAAGRIRIAGEDLAAMRPRARAHLRRSMGILPSAQGLLGARSVLENVALAAWVAGSTRAEGLRRAHAALTLVGIEVERHGAMAVGRLAEGQRHCVALARALVNRPALLLLDDLLGPLDEACAARIVRVLDPFCAAGVTVVATTRASPGAPAAAGAPWPERARILALHDGRLGGVPAPAAAAAEAAA